MKLPEFITDKKKRDDLKEKAEVVFAVFTIVAYINHKAKEKKVSNEVPVIHHH